MLLLHTHHTDKSVPHPFSRPWLVTDVTGWIWALQMDWKDQQHVDQAAPSHLTLPTGSAAAINYTVDQPTAAVKMQEVFGLADTPMLGGNLAKVPLVLQLLSPAGRPLHVSQKLMGSVRPTCARLPHCLGLNQADCSLGLRQANCSLGLRQADCSLGLRQADCSLLRQQLGSAAGSPIAVAHKSYKGSTC
jgi:hypothetical protein